MGLLAPTPANTPQVPNLSEADGSIDSPNPLPVVEEQLHICQVASDIFHGKDCLESQKSLTRSLMLDFSEKSEITDASSECLSVVTTCKVDESLTKDDGSASNWSNQVNASTHEEEEEEEDYYDPYDYEDGDGGLVDALCEGIGKINFSESNTAAAKFTGKHTRFRYSSDEIVEEEKVVAAAAISTPSVLRLKGLPTPKGRHLRFPKEEEEN
ncbi:hypothetical protein GH714_015834 [Hevea brasiliensis]|uniref:Uncharacterized protein n=1 Tax=Hevea brasiliensis TaxID=3981 RepID=A0A6A6KS36_HEVBR|nr:hypothetical protein GH714_015834 [Hevea brasiliensis]